jgi:hypothetical protein
MRGSSGELTKAAGGGLIVNRVRFPAACAVLFTAAAILTPAGVRADALSMTEAFNVEDVVHVKVPYYEDLDIHLDGEGSYAIAFWWPMNGHGAGTVLLEKRGGKWSVVKQIGAIVKTAAELEALGVPAKDAKAFVAAIQNTDR